MTKNLIIRQSMLIHGLKQIHVAKLLGVSQATVSLLLRYELAESEQHEIVRKIEESLNENGMPITEIKPPRTQANTDVREKLTENGLTHYQLAEIMGVSPATLGRMLSKELPAKEKNRIIWIIENRSKYSEMLGANV